MSPLVSLDMQLLSPLSSSSISVLLLLNPVCWAIQPPFLTNKLLILWVIIRIFDSQNGVGWPQPSRKENGHHADVGSYNSRRLLLYQVLPTPLVSGLTGGLNGGLTGGSPWGGQVMGNTLETQKSGLSWSCCAGTYTEYQPSWDPK